MPSPPVAVGRPSRLSKGGRGRGPAHGSTYLVKRSHHAMSERWVWEALARAGVPAADVISLLQNARDDFRPPVPYTVH